MQTLLLLAILAVLLRAELAHAVTWLRVRLAPAVGGVGSWLDKPGLMRLAIGVLIGLLAMPVVRLLPVTVDWPEWVPNVPVITVEKGPRNILIVRESEQDTNTKLDSALVSLRNGMPAEYLKSKSHLLLILDPDATDASNQPSPALKPWFEKFPSRQHPVMIVSDKAGKVLYAEPLASDATADSILAIVKANE